MTSSVKIGDCKGLQIGYALSWLQGAAEGDTSYLLSIDYVPMLNRAMNHRASEAAWFANEYKACFAAHLRLPKGLQISSWSVNEANHYLSASIGFTSEERKKIVDTRSPNDEHHRLGGREKELAAALRAAHETTADRMKDVELETHELNGAPKGKWAKKPTIWVSGHAGARMLD